MTLYEKAQMAYTYGTLAGGRKAESDTVELFYLLSGRIDENTGKIIMDETMYQPFINGVMDIMKHNPVTFDEWVEQEAHEFL